MSLTRTRVSPTLAASAALLAPLLAAGVPAHAQTTSRPADRWGFDEGTGATAAAADGGGDAGTLQGDAGWGAGLVGAHALRLSGRPGGFVDVPRPVVDTTKSYTVAACVRLKRVSGYQTFVSIDGDRISGFFLQLRDDTGEFALTAPPGDGTEGGGGAVAIASSHVAPDPGVWYHVAGVYDAGAQTLALYVNGTLQETVPFKTPWRATGHTAIGRGKYGGSPVDFVDGEMDDVRVYAAALSGAEVRDLARADLPPGTDAAAAAAAAAGPATLAIHAGRPGPRVSPTLYGLMTEEINYSYDGGLYGELIQNRQFKNDPTNPAHWALVQDGGGTGAMALDAAQPLNAAQGVSLKLTVGAAAAGQRVGVANDGYWGIPVRPNTAYRASLWVRAAPGFAGPLALALESADGKTTYARAQVAGVTGGWRKYTATLKTGSVKPTAAARFVVSADRPGTIWLSLVSLFPPTFRDRPNGNRIDLMQKMAAMRPAFLRLPGGNYLEGDTVATRFDWKKTLGPLEGRPGHQGPWGYRSDDGMGLLEFLEWCEDLHMEPVLAVYAGYSLKGEHVQPGADLAPYVQDALDEIEYVTGDAKTTRWGARRARDGHPAPFPLHYVEVGNEDQFDRSRSYDGRFSQFHDAIKSRYPGLRLIATTTVTGRKPDVIDEHYYKAARAFERDAHHYDGYDRKGPKIFVGEWASQDIDRPWVDADKKGPTPTLNSALGDAAWMTGMERNSDVVVMESYAPLLVNVNPGGRQWAVNLIGYDALSSYGSPSYWAQVMFAANHGDTVLPSTLADRQLFASVTRDSKTGVVFVKLVNVAGAARPVHVTLDGVRSVAPTGTAVTLSGSGPADTNSLSAPTKIVPVTRPATGLGTDFRYTVPPYSVTVLRMPAR